MKPAMEIFRGWREVIEHAGRLFVLRSERKDAAVWLNKNATDMGTSVAVELNQRDWLNCYAETRPGGLSRTSTDFDLNIKHVSFL
jgi:hypothetical protein